MRDPSGRRRVQDDRVVDRSVARRAARPGPGAHLAPYCFVDLADQEHVTDAGRDRRREVDGTETLEQVAGAAELVEQLQVLEQGALRVDREPRHLTAPAAHRDLALDV